MGFGGANLTGGGSTNFFTLKGGEHGATGHNHYRVLPSYGKLAESGKWFTYYGQHFGFRGVNPNDSEGTPRPFKCIREKDRKSGLIKVDCPACVVRDGVLAKKEALEQRLKAQGAGKEEVQAATKEFSEWLMANNLDKKFYVAAMNQKREFGILKLPFEAKDKLQIRVKEVLEQEGVHPLLLDQGVWFDFKRTGERLNTSYDVDVVYESVAGEGGKRLRQLKTEPISIEEAEKALKTLPELVDLPRVLTETQIQALIDSDGNPETVDAIMGISQQKGTQERAARSQAAQSGPSAPAPTHVGGPAASAIRQPAGTPAPSSLPPVTAAAPTADAAALLAQIQALQAQLAQQASAPAAPTTPAPADVTASLPTGKPGFASAATPSVDAEEFLKSWGAPAAAAK